MGKRSESFRCARRVPAGPLRWRVPCCGWRIEHRSVCRRCADWPHPASVRTARVAGEGDWTDAGVGADRRSEAAFSMRAIARRKSRSGAPLRATGIRADWGSRCHSHPAVRQPRPVRKASPSAASPDRQFVFATRRSPPVIWCGSSMSRIPNSVGDMSRSEPSLRRR